MRRHRVKTTEDLLFMTGHVLIVLILILWPWLARHLNDAAWQCLFNRYTGLYCPACGGTRAFDQMIHGHLIQSLKYNPVVIYFFGLFSWFMISWYVQKLSRNRIRIGMKFKTVYVYIGLIILMVSWLIKNGMHLI